MSTPSAPTNGWTARRTAAAAAWRAATPVALLGVVAVLLQPRPWGPAVEVVAFLLALTAVRHALRRGPAVRGAWYGVGGALAAFALSSAADVVSLTTASARVEQVAYGVEAGLDIAGYGSIGAAALAMLLTGRRRTDREAWLDVAGLLLAAALAVVAFAGAADGTRGSAELEIGMPLFTAIVLLVCVPLMAPGNGRTTSGSALLAAGGLTLLGYGAKVAELPVGVARFFELLPLLAVAAITLAARHPSVLLLGRRESRGANAAARVLGLGAALLVSPGLVLLIAFRTGGTAWLLGIGTAVLTGLTLWRLGRLNAERERTRAALAAGEARLRVLLENATDVIAIVGPDYRFSYVSPAIEALLGAPPERYLGIRALGLVDPRDRDRLLAAVPGWGSGTAAGHDVRSSSAGTDVRMRRHDDSLSWVEIKVSDRVDAFGVDGWVVNLREVTDRKGLEEELRRQALTDPLTGLANRAALMQRLERDRGAAVVFVDLDDFKSVNDSHGHAVGDELLLAVAGRLASCTRADDVVARLGGDEFALLLPGADPVRLHAVADRVIDQLRRPIRLSAGLLTVTASVGGALADPDDEPEALLHRADTAMYAAKRQGKDGCVLLGADEVAPSS